MRQAEFLPAKLLIAIALLGAASAVAAQTPGAEGAAQGTSPEAAPAPNAAVAAAGSGVLPADPPTQGERIRRLRREQLLREGEQSYLYARELADDQMERRAVEILEDFLDLYSDHPRRPQALQLLARLQSESGRVEQAANTLIRAYREAPAGEAGMRSYLQAGRLLAGQGETERARRIFLEVQNRASGSAVGRLAEQELAALSLPPAIQPPETSGEATDRDRPPSGATEAPLFPDAGQSQGPRESNANEAAEAAEGAGRMDSTEGGSGVDPRLDRMGEGVESMSDSGGTRGQN